MSTKTNFRIIIHDTDHNYWVICHTDGTEDQECADFTSHANAVRYCRDRGYHYRTVGKAKARQQRQTPTNIERMNKHQLVETLRTIAATLDQDSLDKLNEACEAPLFAKRSDWSVDGDVSIHFYDCEKPSLDQMVAVMEQALTKAFGGNFAGTIHHTFKVSEVEAAAPIPF